MPLLPLQCKMWKKMLVGVFHAIYFMRLDRLVPIFFLIFKKRMVVTDSGKVSSSFICIGPHPSVYYIWFDFLHKVIYHQLNWFLFKCSLMDWWILLKIISRWVSSIFSISFPEWAVRADVRLSKFFSECWRIFLTVVN